MALLPSMRRHLCHCCICNCCPHDNGVVAVVDAQAFLPSLRWHHCPCNNGVAALDLQWHCCPCCHGAVAILKLHCCPCCNGVVVIIDAVALVAHHQAGIIELPLMRRHLCCCCNGNCSSCHNCVAAVVDVQVSLPLSS